MQIFTQMTEYFTQNGVWGLSLNSFIESFFLVPPPDFLLIAMDLAKPDSALYYALICTIASALGGGVGYIIGKFGGRPAFNWLIGMFAKDKEKANKNFLQVEKLYNEYGPMAVFLAAFTPIPYKVFTIASGVFKMKLIPFMLVSIVGRGLRFFFEGGLLMLFGEKIKSNLELIMILFAVFVVLFYVIVAKWKDIKLIFKKQNN